MTQERELTSDNIKTESKTNIEQGITNTIEVDANTYLSMQIAELDNNAAQIELLIAEQQYNLAKIKKQKTQTIIDFNIDQLKKQQEQKTSKG